MISFRTKSALLFSILCLGVIVASFFASLLFMDIVVRSDLPAEDPRTLTERLATQRLGSYAELPTLAGQLGLKFGREIRGQVDTFSRISERDVTMAGWVADPEGDATPNELLVFVGGVLAARTKTSGERPDVQQSLNLYFGSEKNLGFQVTLACAHGEQPVLVALGKSGRYSGVVTPPCP